MDKYIGVGDEVKVAQCHDCRHYVSGLTCAAFVKIPLDIYMNRHDHRQPYPGDGGIMFEAIDDRDNQGTEQAA